MLKSFLLSFVLIFQVIVAQKCSYVFDDKNVFKTVQCVNLASMIDIADEIQGNWTSIKIVNRASHPSFSNNAESPLINNYTIRFGSVPKKFSNLSLVSSIAVNVPHLNVIQSLDLSRIGSLTLSDAGFRDFDSLKKLDISQTGLPGLKSSWFTKKTIEELNVSENYIKALKKEETKFFTRLRVFNASFNEIKTVEPNTFLESKKIEVISLSNNQIVNAAFENLPNLVHLFMKGNSIVTVFAVSYHKLPRLETLNLAENEITGVVDRSFSTLESLKYLNLSNNKLPNVGPWMFAGASNIKLEELDFSFNLIQIIYPICFHELKVLTFLDLSNNKIAEIFDKNFMKSTTLQTLNICRNRISKIAPKSFEKMLALKSLDISNNKLETFTAEVFNGNAFAGNKLRKLNLSFNLLTTLKENLFALFSSLTDLDLSSNKFSTLPADLLKSNVNLQKLVLSNNQIQSFSSGFFDSLTALQNLVVDGNRISFLPAMTGPRRLLKLTMSSNPWQCNCLHDTILWAKNNRVQLDDEAFNPPFLSCVVIPETTCIKDVAQITRYQLFDKYQDEVASTQAQFGRKRVDL